MNALKTNHANAVTALQKADAAIKGFDQKFQTDPFTLANNIAPKTVAQVRADLLTGR